MVHDLQGGIHRKDLAGGMWIWPCVCAMLCGTPSWSSGSCSVGPMSEQPVEESLITLWAVVVWRQVYVLSGLADWV